MRRFAFTDIRLFLVLVRGACGDRIIVFDYRSLLPERALHKSQSCVLHVSVAAYLELLPKNAGWQFRTAHAWHWNPLIR
ncbi:uncharacterized protein PHACADRAFT_266332 [Phanerochaete carnosa HHB-10118-sp]|uniref:Secreted protein n=1 Tax=Phanerochaete carnosa (strain HHB-10118-sp) TaxID=650164 RepID=K5VPH9_PHACS|nr:uncharacterized protein PHACADRAFT_266332 [Phanerochaete carnosa HHB-10118-sp]EKM48484.1 hypothetical protein PHACADRAFT_266332 [Phanerochaete carnosa HHB-10118-sp]